MIISHVNVNSLCNKLNNVYSSLVVNEIDILGISETWLTSDVNNSFVSLPGYDIVRSDSPGIIKKHGVAMYIKTNIKYSVVECPVKNVIVVYLCSFNLYIVTIYRPPSYTDLENRGLCEYVTNFCAGKETVVQGDFNLPSIVWSLEDVFTSYISPLDRFYYDVFVSLGFTQIVKVATNFPSGNILDLFFTTNHERVGHYEVLPPLPCCSHGVVLVSYVFQSIYVNKSSDVRSANRICTKGKYELIARCLVDIDWYSELFALGAEEQYDRFLAIMWPLIDQYVPLHKSGHSNKLPWAVNPPRSLLNTKNEAWSSYKSCRSVYGRYSPVTMEAWLKFQFCNNSIKLFAINSQKAYEKSIAMQINSSPKLFHSYLKHRKVCRPSVGPIKLSDNSLTDDPHIMASFFVDSFASVFTNDIPLTARPNQLCNDLMVDMHVTPNDVVKALDSLDPNASMGVDAMHPRYLKSLSHVLAVPLSIIFNSSLREGRLPSSWVKSIVVPIFKSSSRFNPLNYRPISLTSVTCKTLEKIITYNLKLYLDVNSLISDHQFGFRSGYSTVDQLLITYNDITACIDNGQCVDIVFFDYAKAFDKVCYNVLLQKLSDIGVCAQLLN